MISFIRSVNFQEESTKSQNEMKNLKKELASQKQKLVKIFISLY